MFKHAIWPVLMVSSVANATPLEGVYQGRLLDVDGLGVTGTHSLTVRLYDNEADVTASWTETHASVPVVDGYFTVVLGSHTPLDTLSGYLGVSVDSGSEWSRQLVHQGSPAFGDVVCGTGETARATSTGWACGTARTPLGRLDVPISFSGTLSGWRRVNVGTHVGFAWDAYDDYLAPGQTVEARLCMSYTDSGSHSEKIQVRLQSTDTGTVHWSDQFHNTWSGSGLVHSDCLGWQSISLLQACADDADGRCQMQGRHTASTNAVLYQMWWELSAI